MGSCRARRAAASSSQVGDHCYQHGSSWTVQGERLDPLTLDGLHRRRPTRLLPISLPRESYGWMEALPQHPVGSLPARVPPAPRLADLDQEQPQQAYFLANGKRDKALRLQAAKWMRR